MARLVSVNGHTSSLSLRSLAPTTPLGPPPQREADVPFVPSVDHVVAQLGTFRNIYGLVDHIKVSREEYELLKKLPVVLRKYLPEVGFEAKIVDPWEFEPRFLGFKLVVPPSPDTIASVVKELAGIAEGLW